ncbi:MAG: flagellar basal body-associated protein FliL, partial [Chloroflexota bacterium]
PEEPQQPKEDPHAAPIFFDIPDMLVNLNSAGKRPAFLKIKIAIQVAKHEDVPAVEHDMPRIIDSFQVTNGIHQHAG